MADIADDAERVEQTLRDAALTRRRPVAPPAVGFCLNCGEETLEGRRWCDPDCREDWQKRRRARDMRPREPDAVLMFSAEGTTNDDAGFRARRR